MEVKEVGHVQVVSTPSEHVKPVQATVGGFINELTGLHHNNFGFNAQVVPQLGLDFNSNQCGFRQIYTEDVTIED